ncbi:hypothetical protein D3C80_1823540 [compost metagenome]
MFLKRDDPGAQFQQFLGARRLAFGQPGVNAEYRQDQPLHGLEAEVHFIHVHRKPRRVECFSASIQSAQCSVPGSFWRRSSGIASPQVSQR